MSRKTIFERYGGFTRISRVVMGFYDKMLDSPVCSPYFAHTDMKRLVDHQTKFIASLMGGPASYSNEQLERVHAHLGITEAAFLESVTLMQETKQKQAEYMLESYSQLAERNAKELEREKVRAERLLLNIMPKGVYEEMKDFGTVTPQLFENASILMVDFVGHTEMAIARDPAALVTELNDIFTVFDRIVDMFGCERIRTVGDGYVAVSGLPDQTPDHAVNLSKVALRMLRYIERRNSAHTEAWHCRIGINTGPVIGSLVGIQKYVYDIFGPGINMASRMETLSEAMKITISESTYQLIKDEFVCTERGKFEVKGFGLAEVETAELAAQLAADALDVTLPGRQPARGRLHIITQTLRDIYRIFGDMGFQVYRSPDVETDAYNFELLNFPPHHPAREMQDSFYTTTDVILRTHTSAGRSGPCANIIPNRCASFCPACATATSRLPPAARFSSPRWKGWPSATTSPSPT
jgi:class 3 adenylate cyclase